MAITSFIQTIWSARMLENLNNNLVYGSVVNRDYEGEIIQGGSVKIPFQANVTVDDYDGSDIGDPEELTGDVLTMNIDKKKFFNFAIDDVDKAQIKVNAMDAAMKSSGYAVGNEIDKDIAAEVDNATTTMDDGQQSPGAIEVDKDNAVDVLIDAVTKLKELNVDLMGAFAIVPSWMAACLVKSDYFAKNAQVGAQTLINGFVGKVAGLNILESNNVPVSNGVYKVMVGTPKAVSFAMQINTVEAYRPQGGFKDAVKGLTVYGIKTIQPKAMIKLLVKKG